MYQEYSQYVRKHLLQRWTSEFMKWAVYLIIIIKVNYQIYESQHDARLIRFLYVSAQDKIGKLRNIATKLIISIFTYKLLLQQLFPGHFFLLLGSHVYVFPLLSKVLRDVTLKQQTDRCKCEVAISMSIYQFDKFFLDLPL